LESFTADEQIIGISVLEAGKFLILILQFNFTYTILYYEFLISTWCDKIYRNKLKPYFV